MHKSEGDFIRSKADWVEFGERNTKYFANLEKWNYKTKCISKLITEKRELNSQREILLEEQRFYENLYTSKGSDATCQEYFINNENIQKLTEEQKMDLESPMSIEELSKALKELPNGKSPGSDGFSTDFYKKNCPHIKFLVYKSVTFAYENGELSIEQKEVF